MGTHRDDLDAAQVVRAEGLRCVRAEPGGRVVRGHAGGLCRRAGPGFAAGLGRDQLGRRIPGVEDTAVRGESGQAEADGATALRGGRVAHRITLDRQTDRGTGPLVPRPAQRKTSRSREVARTQFHVAQCPPVQGRTGFGREFLVIRRLVVLTPGGGPMTDSSGPGRRCTPRGARRRRCSSGWTSPGRCRRPGRPRRRGR